MITGDMLEADCVLIAQRQRYCFTCTNTILFDGWDFSLVMSCYWHGSDSLYSCQSLASSLYSNQQSFIKDSLLIISQGCIILYVILSFVSVHVSYTPKNSVAI